MTTIPGSSRPGLRVNLPSLSENFPFAVSFEMNPSASMRRQKPPVPVNSAGTRELVSSLSSLLVLLS